VEAPTSEPKDEWERYSVAITEWEIEEYMRLY
jgi:glutamine synthetase